MRRASPPPPPSPTVARLGRASRTAGARATRVTRRGAVGSWPPAVQVTWGTQLAAECALLGTLCAVLFTQRARGAALGVGDALGAGARDALTRRRGCARSASGRTTVQTGAALDALADEYTYAGLMVWDQRNCRSVISDEAMLCNHSGRVHSPAGRVSGCATPSTPAWRGVRLCALDEEPEACAGRLCAGSASDPSPLRHVLLSLEPRAQPARRRRRGARSTLSSLRRGPRTRCARRAWRSTASAPSAMRRARRRR